MKYNIEISEHPARDGHFVAKCRETGTEFVSPDPEHDVCHWMKQALFPDGSVQFWRAGTMTLSHSSIYKMAKYRISLRDNFPARVKRDVFSTERPRG